MQTRFSHDALADPATAASEAIIRKCVHCGFCTATCPTYVLLGDELDSPRGRIYLIKEMLENQREPTAEVVKHIDRCLSCLSCTTTCPSGVDYMHLVDHARAYIEQRYRRSLVERAIRSVLAWVLPHPRRFRLALSLARLVKPITPAIAAIPALKPVAAMLELAPQSLPPSVSVTSQVAAEARGRVAVLAGCAEPVLRPAYRAATVRLLNRAGYAVVPTPGEGCCGALVHHMGREEAALREARRNVDVWIAEMEERGLDAIVVTASGCGTTIKDYGHMLRGDPAYAEKAARVSAMTKDVSEFLFDKLDFAGAGTGLTVAYHAACSLQHGQKITDAPKRLLAAAGYLVRTPIEAHLCCGSAGTYNILQPELAGRLAARKVTNLEHLAPDVIATGNIGCAMQIGRNTSIPLVHIVELLDWAAGGPTPISLTHLENRNRQ